MTTSQFVTLQSDTQAGQGRSFTNGEHNKGSRPIVRACQMATVQMATVAMKSVRKKTSSTQRHGAKVADCETCPLKSVAALSSIGQLDTLPPGSLQHTEITIQAGKPIIGEAERQTQLYTVIEGWCCRYRTLSDGRRKILEHMLPGDLLGLDAAIAAATGEDLRTQEISEHGVDALTDVRLCVLPMEGMAGKLHQNPGLALELLHIAHRQNRILAQNLYYVGGQKPAQRVASLLLQLYERASKVGLAAKDEILLPFTQNHLGESVALSHVHTQRTLKQLASRNLVTWNMGKVTFVNRRRLIKFADYVFQDPEPRPYLCCHSFAKET